MFCPSCGANNSTEQKFCRSCGMNLEMTSISLLEQFPTAQRASLQKRERMLERFGQVAFGGFGIVLFLAISSIIYWIVTQIILGGKTPLEQFGGVLLAFFIIFAFLAITYVVINEDLKERKQKLNPALDKVLENPGPARVLEDKPFEPVPSIVEDTTELLAVENKTREL